MVSPTAQVQITNLKPVLSSQFQFPTNNEPLQLYYLLGLLTGARQSHDFSTNLSPLLVSDLRPTIVPLSIHLFLQYVFLGHLSVSDNMINARNIMAAVSN